MKKKMYRIIAAILMGVLIFSMAACQKKEKIEIVYDEEMGYDLTELFGRDMDEVLDTLEVAGVEIKECDEGLGYHRSDTFYACEMKDIQYGFETTNVLNFYRLEDSKKMQFVSYAEIITLPEWPNADTEVAQMIIKQYADLAEQYGKPTMKTPTLQETEKIMNKPAYRSASWDSDDENIIVDFSISGAKAEVSEYPEFTFSVIYRNMDAYKIIWKDRYDILENAH